MAVFTAVAPARKDFIAPITVSGKITIRKSVYALSETEITQYRLAVYRLAQISAKSVQDHRGYQYIGGVHGLPGRYCQHHTPAFALWHRPFMQGFEQRLQDVVADSFVPYWDWTTAQAQEEGIPRIFTDPTWNNPDNGKVEPNPLLSQPILINNQGNTSREPNSPSELNELATLVQEALLAGDYPSFSPDLENPHDSLHMWVGGTMGDIAYAAYDPLFWSHHSFVEYLFCQWQDAHPEALPPDLDPRFFAPFSVTTDQVWDYHSLGYKYAPSNTANLQIAGVSHGPGAATAESLCSRATVAYLPLKSIAPDFHRAEFRFEGLTPPADTMAVRFFLNQRDATAQTPTVDNPHYLGTRYFFGHGECGGAEGHCDVTPRDIFDLRPRHHYAPIKVRLNVTNRLRQLLVHSDALRNSGEDIAITLVVVDRVGTEVFDSGLYFEGLSVIIR